MKLGYFGFSSNKFTLYAVWTRGHHIFKNIQKIYISIKMVAFLFIPLLRSFKSYSFQRKFLFYYFRTISHVEFRKKLHHPVLSNSGSATVLLRIIICKNTSNNKTSVDLKQVFRLITTINYFLFWLLEKESRWPNCNT